VIQEAIRKIVGHEGLTAEQARACMKEIMEGKATPAQIGAFLTALRMKGETVTEVTEFAKVMREFCVRIAPSVNGRLIDTCGTGGDSARTINVSTAAALIGAAAGAYVAKHGNRAVSSSSGSADVLEALGVNIQASSDVVTRCIEKAGLGFLFAPVFHPAMKNALAPRKEIGIRTIFNLLGPLTNPAGARGQVIGVYDERIVELVAQVLVELGVEAGLVVHGSGLDEITVTGPTKLAWVQDGQLKVERITPGDLGLENARVEELQVASREESVEQLYKLLAHPDEVSKAKVEFSLVNTSASLVVAGVADTLVDGLELASEALQSGAALEKLRQLVKESGGSTARLDELESRFG